MAKGKFVISLDFEIYWGVRDAVKLKDYKENLLGVHESIPLLLNQFEKFGIKATFATVGFLFFQNKKELCNNLPAKKPQYSNPNLSPYNSHIQSIGNDEKEDPLHYGFSLIKQIGEAGQEIGSHSFSHYYCLEKGQSPEEFKEDLIAGKKIAEKNNIHLNSFIFSRDQYNKRYLELCSEMGFTSFRGNERSWLFSSKTLGKITTFRRPFRLLDAYLNLSGHNCYSYEQMKISWPFNIASSRFLRPYNKSLKYFEGLKLKRITKSMTYAAKNGLTFHLWWHPHNFGIDIPENFSFLEKVLIHYQQLNNKFEFESVNMQQLANELSQKDNH